MLLIIDVNLLKVIIKEYIIVPFIFEQECHSCPSKLMWSGVMVVLSQKFATKVHAMPPGRCLYTYLKIEKN